MHRQVAGRSWKSADTLNVYDIMISNIKDKHPGGSTRLRSQFLSSNSSQGESRTMTDASTAGHGGERHAEDLKGSERGAKRVQRVLNDTTNQ